jgi:hypothetical protein
MRRPPISAGRGLRGYLSKPSRRGMLGMMLAAATTAAHAQSPAQRAAILGGVALGNPPSATGEVGSSGTFFGFENSWQPLTGNASGYAATTIAADSKMLGAAQTLRRVTVPAVNMPAVGTDWAFCFAVYIERDATGAQTQVQAIACTSGATYNSGNGGGLVWAPYAFAPMAAQELGITRNSGSSYHMFGTAGNTQVATGIKLVQGCAYMVAVGRSGALSKIAVAQIDPATFYLLTDRVTKASPIDPEAVQSFTATATGVQPTTIPLFDCFGGDQNAASQKLGFSGGVADHFFITGAFPTDAQLKNLARGVTKVTDVPTAIAGATLTYYNKLDWSARSGTALAAAVDPGARGAATLVGANHCGMTPIRQGTGIGLTLDRLHRGFTMPLKKGATTGRVWAIGTCSIPGYPVYMRLVDFTGAAISGFDWTKVAGASPSGKYRVYLDGVPQATRFHVEVSLGNPATSNHIIRSRTPCQLGLKLLSASNQSELNVVFGSGFTPSDGTETVGSSGGTVVPPVTSYPGGGNWLGLSWTFSQSTATQTHVPTINVTPGDRMAIMNGQVGDALTEAFNRMALDHPCGLWAVVSGKSGHHLGATLLDDQVYTQTATGFAGGTTYSGNLTLDLATIRTLFPLIPATSTLGGLNHVRPGSVVLNFPGGVTVVDQNGSTKDTGQYTGNLYLSTDLTTSIGTVTYNATAANAAINITFPSSVAAGNITQTWRLKQITNSASYVVEATWTNGSPVGSYSIWDYCQELMAPHLEYGFSAFFAVPGAANLYGTDAGATGDYGVQQKYLRDRYSALFQAANPGLEAAVSSPDTILLPKFRDTNSNYANLCVSRYAMRLLAADSGDAAARADVFHPGDFYDNMVDAASSPHSGGYMWGGARFGRHFGRSLSAFKSNDRSKSRGPKLDIASRTFPSANVCRIPAILGAGRRLTVTSTWTYAGPGTTPVITQAAGNPNALDCFFVNGTLVDNGATYVASIEAGARPS